MKTLTKMKMDLKFISHLLMMLSSLAPIVYSNFVGTDIDEYIASYSTLNSKNYTRGKRQLFREDIPHHRPLSGNLYAHHHGFPHPGRWSDGSSSQHKPRPNVFPSHQQYIDMIDNDQHGNYHSRPKVPHPFSGFREVDNGAGIGFGPPYKPLFDNDGPNSDFGLGHPGPMGHSEPSGIGYGGPGPAYNPGPSKASVYGPPQHKGHKGPKTVVHYHPVQYGNVLNFPDSGSSHNKNPSSGYGPPNHSSGEPIGPNIQSGFIPSKGFFGGIGGGGSGFGDGGYNNDDHRIHHHNMKEAQHQFEPFKMFSNPSHPPKSVGHEVPIPIPILAHFHSAKPLKFTKIRHPIHLIYENAPRRRPGHGQQFHRQYPDRPYKSNWILEYGL